MESTLAWTDHMDATEVSFTKEKKFYNIYFQIGDSESSVEKKAPDGESVEKDSQKEKRNVVWTAACCGNDGKKKKTRQPSSLDTLRRLEWTGSGPFMTLQISCKHQLNLQNINFFHVFQRGNCFLLYLHLPAASTPPSHFSSIPKFSKLDIYVA